MAKDTSGAEQFLSPTGPWQRRGEGLGRGRGPSTLQSVAQAEQVVRTGSLHSQRCVNKTRCQMLQN